MKYRRRHHEIPADQGERGGVAEFHGCFFSTVRQSEKETQRALIGLPVFREFSFPRGGDGFLH